MVYSITYKARLPKTGSRGFFPVFGEFFKVASGTCRPKDVPESPEPQTRGIFRFLSDSLFLIGTYPRKLLKCLMPATDSGKCFYSPGAFLRWLAEAAHAAETAAARTVPS